MCRFSTFGYGPSKHGTKALTHVPGNDDTPVSNLCFSCPDSENAGRGVYFWTLCALRHTS